MPPGPDPGPDEAVTAEPFGPSAEDGSAVGLCDVPGPLVGPGGEVGPGDEVGSDGRGIDGSGIDGTGSDGTGSDGGGIVGTGSDGRGIDGTGTLGSGRVGNGRVGSTTVGTGSGGSVGRGSGGSVGTGSGGSVGTGTGGRVTGSVGNGSDGNATGRDGSASWSAADAGPSIARIRSRLAVTTVAGPARRRVAARRRSLGCCMGGITRPEGPASTGKRSCGPSRGGAHPGPAPCR